MMHLQHSIYLSKEADESEYVLFEENFDNIEDGQLPEGWEDQKTGTVNVQDGALFIDGTGDDYGATSVLLPEYLGLFGNYKIEADFTHVVAK